MYCRVVRKYVGLHTIGDLALCFFDLARVALVKGPLFDTFSPQQPGLQEDLQVFAGGGLADPEFLRDQHSAHTVLHQVTIHLGPKVFPRMLEPREDLQPPVVRQRPQNQFRIHIDN